MIQTTVKNYETIRTTVNLPAELLQRSQKLIDEGLIPNRNTLIVLALENFLAEMERQTIDEQFAAMMDDKDYQLLNEDYARPVVRVRLRTPGRFHHDQVGVTTSAPQSLSATRLFLPLPLSQFVHRQSRRWLKLVGFAEL